MEEQDEEVDDGNNCEMVCSSEYPETFVIQKII